MENQNLKITTRIACRIALLMLALYLINKNYPIFKTDVVLGKGKISDLTPSGRVINFPKPPLMTDNLIYFETTSKGYDSATVVLTYSSLNPHQEIQLGYRDNSTWHYHTKPIFLPFFEGLTWEKVGNSPPFLYQKSPVFASTENLLKNPPKDKAVGTYYLTEDHSINVLNGYAPKSSETVINTPLRGSHTFYTYLNDEPFRLSIEKQDLNWYEGADTLEIKVYKDKKLLSQKKIEDDGVTDTSRIPGITQAEVIKYEEGNPENGVYKIVLKAGNDLMIKSIKSSFNKIVFEGPVFPLSGSEIYPMAGESAESLIYTDSSKLSFVTAHEKSLSEIDISGKKLTMDKTSTPFKFESQSERNIIKASKGDVKIDGNGYFSFDIDQFFTPFIYKKFEVKSTDDLSQVDFLLTDYSKPFDEDGWKTKEINFSLTDAYYSNGKLSWLIKAPNLKESGGKIMIKEIKVILHQDPIIKFN